MRRVLTRYALRLTKQSVPQFGKGAREHFLRSADSAPIMLCKMKLLTYATGRSMTFRDQPEIKRIAAESAEVISTADKYDHAFCGACINLAYWAKSTPFEEEFLSSLAPHVRTLAKNDVAMLVDTPAFAAFEAVGYQEYLTFEYFHPWQHFPEALIHQTSDSLDRMLGRV